MSGLQDGLLQAKLLNSVAFLPVGAYNTLVLSFVAFLCVWAGESVKCLIQCHRIQQRILWQGGAALCLRGMSAYTPDFKRLKRTHLSQILRLRKSLPAIIMPRVLVSFCPSPLPPVTERTIRFELQVRGSITSVSGQLRAALFGGVPLPTLASYVQFVLSTMRRDYMEPAAASSSWSAREPPLDKLKPLIVQQDTQDIVSCSTGRILWDLFVAEQDPLLPRKYFAGPDMVVPFRSSSLELQLPGGYMSWLNDRCGSLDNSYLLLYVVDQEFDTAGDQQDELYYRSHAFGVPAGITCAILVKLVPDTFCGFTVGRPIFYTDFVISSSRLLQPENYYATYRKFTESSSSNVVVANDGEIPDQALISIAMDGTNNGENQGAEPADSARHILSTMWRGLSRMVGVGILRASRNNAHRTAADLFNSSPLPIPPSPTTLQAMFTAGLREKDIYGLDNETEMDCLICMSEKKQTILLPCGHSSCCVECLKSLRKEKCPVCRGNFTASVILPVLR